MKLIHSKLLILLLLAVSPGLAQAADPSTLATVSVAVPDRSEATRSSAVLAGLDRVLIRLTGQRHPVADSMRGRATRYVLQYSYATREVPSLTDPTTRRQQLFLDIRFDDQAVSREIVGAGLPLWGGERPDTLLWLITEREDGAREVLIDGATSEVAASVNEVADVRGIPLLLPLMDVEDQSLVTTSDLWAAFEARLREASLRYAADVVVTARVAHVARDRWEARWTRLDADRSVAWVTEQESAALAVSEGLNMLVDEYAARFSVGAGAATSGLHLRVSGVTDFAAYARVLRHLEGLTVVQSVSLLQTDASDLDLIVVASGGREALVSALSLGSVLVPAGTASDGPVPDAVLLFDLRP